jgi:hypothetical protein
MKPGSIESTPLETMSAQAGSRGGQPMLAPGAPREIARQSADGRGGSPAITCRWLGAQLDLRIAMATIRAPGVKYLSPWQRFTRFLQPGASVVIRCDRLCALTENACYSLYCSTRMTRTTCCGPAAGAVDHVPCVWLEGWDQPAFGVFGWRLGKGWVEPQRNIR